MTYRVRQYGTACRLSDAVQQKALKGLTPNPNPNVLAVISKGMWTIKLHCNNPPVLNSQYQLMQVILYFGHEMAAVVVLSGYTVT